MAQYLYDHSLQKTNLDLIRNITHISGEVMDTYMAEGLRLNSEEFMYGDMYNGELLMTFTSPQLGAGLVADLKKIAEEKGVDIRVSSPATRLLTDENGAVTGVEANGENGIYKIYAKTVVLATGGFANDDELMNKYAPSFAENRMLTATVGSTGDGHRMVLDLGGSIIGENIMGTYALADGTPTHLIPEGTLARSGKFVVNKEGERFSKEYTDIENGDEYFVLVSKQSDNKAFSFFDSNSEYLELLESAAENGKILKADTLEELAQKAGIHYETFAAEVETYNNDYAAGSDDSKWGQAKDEMAPLTTEPFYMMEILPWSTMGVLAGVKANEHCQILKANDEPIPNLYGAGELIMGNVVYDRYPSCGTALATGMYGGVIAVRHALG
jgi:fumarate reductase flavoprotein subunit